MFVTAQSIGKQLEATTASSGLQAIGQDMVNPPVSWESVDSVAQAHRAR
jgi:hypothetical protein